MDESEACEVLSRLVFPKLQLTTVQALRQTCKSLQAVVGALQADAWKAIARCLHTLHMCQFADVFFNPLITPPSRNTLPEDHSLCVCSPPIQVPAEAARLAQVYTNLRAGRPVEVAALSVHRGRTAEPREGWNTITYKQQ